MRKVALAIAASLVLAVVAPAFSQPFADVPTDHWAFDAIAELAAKGIVEGYPDGTFKGDRAMTRYEMAMVVARLLARIEAIKIPAPAPPAKVPPPEVSRADITTLQRLINEFRAELAALGVRVTAVEEELAALRDRLDNVRVTGDVRFRYNMNGGGTTSAQGPPGVQLRNRLTFRGSATRNVTAVMRAIWGGGSEAAISSNMNFGAPSSGFFRGVSFDLAYLDMNEIFGINWRLGRQAYTLSPIGASNLGLLFDPGNGAFGGVSTAAFVPGVNGLSAVTAVADGLRGSATFGPVGTEFGVFRHNPAVDVWMARAQFGLIPGWTIGVSGISERRNGAAGAPRGAVNTSDVGWSVDLKGNLFPGVGFGAAYATFNPDASVGTSSNAWTVWANINLGSLTGMTTFAPSWAVWYKSYGPGVAPLYSGAFTELYFSYPWNFRGWGTSLTLTFSPTLSATAQYETGTIPGAQHAGAVDTFLTLVPAAAGSSLNEWYASIDYTGLAPRTTLSFRYFRQVVAGTTANSFYRVQMTYSY
jgi:hypothetical protein